jgi:macrolide transport system ATP-binding/permease protein
MRQLRRLAPGAPDDFAINEQEAFVSTFQRVAGTIALVGLFVTSLSLFVGGIGIMNIMFVSVAERTREIGIRMATGARTRNILQQFLIEALVVSAVGGAVGVVLGLGTAAVVNALGTQVQFSLAPVLLAFSCAFGTGLVFGWLPASKAARLDPVVALASE